MSATTEPSSPTRPPQEAEITCADADFLALMASLRVDPVDEGTFVARPLDRGGVIDAGTLMALVTAVAASPGDEVRSVHADFFRPANPGHVVEIEVREVHRGRNLGIKIVTLAQAGRPLAQGQVSSGPTVEDLLAHGLTVDTAGGPPVMTTRSLRYGSFVRVVGNVDPFDPESTRPARWQVWVDCSAASGSGVSHRAFIAFHANQYLVSAAVLPHRGFSMQQAHRGVLTVITSSTVTFHRPVSGGWLLFDQTSTYAGGGWIYGRGEAFGENGELIASFSEAAIMRRAAPASRASLKGT